MSGDPQDYLKKTVSFAPSNSFNNTSNYGNQNYSSGGYNVNPRASVTSTFTGRPSSSIGYNQVNQGNYSAHPSSTTTTFNQSSSQIFTNNANMTGGMYGGGNLIGRNPSMVVKADSLVKIEIYSPELNGSRNRLFSERLAVFIKSLNTGRAKAIARDNYRDQTNNGQDDNSFVNGGVWANQFQNRNSITIVINGIHIVEDFPLTIFNEDPNWNHMHEMKGYRAKFINTISQFSDCKFLSNFDF